MRGARHARTLAVMVAALLLVAMPVAPAAAVLSGGSSVTAPAASSYTAGAGPNVTVADGAGITVESSSTTTTSVTLNTADYGTLYFESDSRTNVTISRVSSNEVNLTGLDVSSATLTIETEVGTADITGDADWLRVSPPVINDKNVDFAYGGTDTGTTTVTIHGIPETEHPISAVDVDTGTVLANATPTGDSVSFSLPLSEHNVSMVTDLDDIAPYYENQSSSVDLSSWTEGRTEPTLDNILNYLGRVGSYVIGTGTAQGGAGPIGVIISGLIMTAIFAGSMVGIGVGPVGGAVLAVLGGGGLTALGLLPGWLYAVILFVLGGVATTVIVRSM